MQDSFYFFVIIFSLCTRVYYSVYLIKSVNMSVVTRGNYPLFINGGEIDNLMHFRSKKMN